MMEPLMLFLLNLLLTWCKVSAITWPHDSGYHNHNQTIMFMKQLQTAYPHLVQLYSIGHSVNRFELLILELSARPGVNTNSTPKRNIRLLGSIYGDEIVGHEILLDFAQYLLMTYPKQGEEVTSMPHLLDLLNVHILPSMNPDGSNFASKGKCSQGMGRYNVERVELDFDFPVTNSPNMAKLQPETIAVMKWIRKVPSILSVTLRANGYVVTYPYRALADKSNPTGENLTPDHQYFIFLANIYADNNEQIKNVTSCRGKNFTQSIVNAAVISKTGTAGRQQKVNNNLMDYSYSKANSLHLDISITCCRYPQDHELADIWSFNQPALTALLGGACEGLDGVVRDAQTREPIANALITVVGHKGVATYTAASGTFSRIMFPGNYTLEVTKDGYETQQMRVNIDRKQEIFIGETNITVYKAYVEILLACAVKTLPPVHDPVLTIFHLNVSSTSEPQIKARLVDPTITTHTTEQTSQASVHRACIISSIVNLLIILVVNEGTACLVR